MSYSPDVESKTTFAVCEYGVYAPRDCVMNTDTMIWKNGVFPDFKRCNFLNLQFYLF